MRRRRDGQPARSATRVRISLGALLALATASLTGCFDFVEPDIPQAGAPASLQLSVVISDDGSVNASALLTPGFDSLGVPRPIADSTLRVMGRPLDPADAGAGGGHGYTGAWTIDGTAALGPISVDLPAVVGAPAPVAPAWHGSRRAGPDTLRLQAGEALVLDLEVDERGTALIRQWFLQMTGEGGSIRLSADGPPPERLVVPSIWLPAPRDDGTFRVTLTDSQSETRAGPAGNYVLSGTLSIRTAWTVRVMGGPG